MTSIHPQKLLDDLAAEFDRVCPRVKVRKPRTIVLREPLDWMGICASLLNGEMTDTELVDAMDRREQA